MSEGEAMESMLEQTRRLMAWLWVRRHMIFKQRPILFVCRGCRREMPPADLLYVAHSRKHLCSRCAEKLIADLYSMEQSMRRDSALSDIARMCEEKYEERDGHIVVSKANGSPGGTVPLMDVSLAPRQPDRRT